MSKTAKDLEPNVNQKLLDSLDKDFKDVKVEWVKENTAILVIHGIGNQFPLETLDQFGRGLIEEYKRHLPDRIDVEHCIMTKDVKDNPWFDNVVRIKCKGSSHNIDLYEYYWANYTEDKATLRDITKWLDGVVDGAKEHYRKNSSLGEAYGDKSPFFDKKTGEFKAWKYWLFVRAIPKSIVITSYLLHFLSRLFSIIPVVGLVLASSFEKYIHNVTEKIANVLGDITIYNVVDPKSCFYPIRRQIMDGAIKALRYVVEKINEKGDLSYPSVIVAGHSLGSQVAYDAINRLNLYVNQDLIEYYDPMGVFKKNKNKKISDQLKGFVTFGSPLDKIAFFLSENVNNEHYLRQSIVASYHCFKQRDMFLAQDQSKKLKPSVKRLLDDIKWVNYYDDDDSVSGSLDYYLGLENLDCELIKCVHGSKSGWFPFTHSDYWICQQFYQHIILTFLSTMPQEQDKIMTKESAIVSEEEDA